MEGYSTVFVSAVTGKCGIGNPLQDLFVPGEGFGGSDQPPAHSRIIRCQVRKEFQADPVAQKIGGTVGAVMATAQAALPDI
jgi:hypothetical protein